MKQQFLNHFEVTTLTKTRRPPVSSIQLPHITSAMNCTPLESLSDLTSSKLLAEASQIADLIPSWKTGGVFEYAVPQADKKVAVHVSNKQNLNNDFWVARLNSFDELSPLARDKLWHQLWDYSIASTLDLADCHTAHEMNYIEEIYDYNASPYELADPPEGYLCFSYLVECFYKLQWPLKKRRFCNLIHILKSDDQKTAYVVGLAVAPLLVPGAKDDAGIIDGQYTSVERLEYDGDKLSWVMTTCSDAKGNVPQWLARSSINSVVAKDVPHFLNWVAKKD